MKASESYNPPMASQLEEQQEKLRRAVDEWRSRRHELLKNLHGDPSGHGPSAGGGGLRSDLVRLHVEPLELAGLPALLESDNVALSKVITVLSFDCIEIAKLSRHASRNLYGQLLLFGYSSSSEEVLLEGEPQKAFGRSLSLVMDLYDTTNRMMAVLGNLIQQLTSVCSPHHKDVRPLNSFKNLMLRTAFESLGEGLAVFLVLDEILKQNSHVKGHLSLFARMLSKVKLEVDAFGISLKDLNFLDQVIGQLEKLLDIGLCHRLFSEESSWRSMLHMCNNKFFDACICCIHDCLSEILPRLDTWKESAVDRRKILYNMALFIFSTYFANAPEKKLGKLILEMLQVVPVVYVEGGKRIILLDVLKSQCPKSLSLWPPLREASRDYDVMMSNYLKRLSEVHLREWQAIKDTLSCWVASFQSGSGILSEACLQLHLKQILQGILLANRMHVLVLSMLDLHALLGVPIKREKLECLCHLIVSLKVVDDTFRKKMVEIIQSLPHIINVIQADIERLLLPSKAKLQSDVTKGSQLGKFNLLSTLTRGGRDVDTRITDSLSLVLISLQLLNGGGSYMRQLVLLITLDVMQIIGYLDIDYPRIRKLISKLGTIAGYQSIIEEVTDCSFLFWRKEMIRNWFSMVYMDVSKFSWLQFLLHAVSDGLWLLKRCHIGKLTLQSYEKDIESALENEIITPLCRDIETDLRLHVHSIHLKGSVYINPTKTGVRNLSWFLQMKPLQIPFKIIDIGLFVESYLNSAFYNHMAMSPYDWKIYSEMRQLAELKYGLVLDDIHLAEHYEENAFEISAIVQNVHVFTANYSYNIFNQMLTEKAPSGQRRKTLRVIGVEHVASSISIYGSRAISNASNSILKFLTQMFTTLSGLLQDKTVKAHLVKEPNFGKSYKGLNPSVQPIELDLVKGKCPLGDHRESAVEQLQSVMTEMGNALGLMKILLAGASRHFWNISGFVSKPRCNMSYMESCQKLGLPDGVVTAGRVVDITTENESADNIASFSSFISLISKDLQSSIYDHLKDFFLTIPSLIENIVDSKVHNMNKPLGRDADLRIVSADDGFIMGVVCVLKVTRQDKSFDELDWFASAKKSLKEAMLSLEDRKGPEPRKGSSFAGLKLWSQAPSISAEDLKGIDKLLRCQKEVELIEYGFNIARAML